MSKLLPVRKTKDQVRVWPERVNLQNYEKKIELNYLNNFHKISTLQFKFIKLFLFKRANIYTPVTLY